MFTDQQKFARPSSHISSVTQLFVEKTLQVAKRLKFASLARRTSVVFSAKSTQIITNR